MNRYAVRQETFGELVYDRETHALTVTLLPDRLGERTVEPRPVLSAPLRVFLVITRACNLACSYCSSHSGRRETDHMTYPFVESLLEQLAAMGVFEIALNGGEPLAHPAFFRIIEKARSLGLCTYLNTNGVMSRTKLGRLAEAGVDKIKISIDGMRESNDAHRGRGSFDRAAEAARFLSSTGNHVRINATLSRRSADDLLPLVSLAEDCGCGLKIAPLANVGRGHNLPEDRFSLMEIREMAAELDRYCGERDIRTHVEFCTSLIEERASGGPRLDRYGKSAQQHLGCCNRYLHATVDTDGSVYASGQQVDLERLQSNGNATTQPLREIWRTLMERNELDREADPVCRACDFEGSLIQVIRRVGARYGEVWQSDLTGIAFGSPD